MRPDCSPAVDIDLGCNPNLLTLSLDAFALQYLTRLLSTLVTPNLQQVTLYFHDYSSCFRERDCCLEIDRILNGQASVHLVEIVLGVDPTLSSKFIEYSPLLWSRGVLKITYLPFDQWPWTKYGM
jgi:hypothetical protein